MSRLVIISNRVSYPSRRQTSTAGGLAVTLQMALQQNGGVWFGWSGVTNETTSAPQQITKNNIDYILLDLTKEQIQNYYYGFSNSTLWPACHYRPDLINYKPQNFQTYLEVNRLFAKNLQKHLKETDIIWVHDYHLIAMAQELRKLGVRNPIGFFLHVPFPCFDIFCTIPTCEKLLADLCAYDLIGFQTKTDEKNFRNCVTNPPKTISLPATIDSEIFEKFSRMQLDKESWRNLAAQLQNQILVMGVDRLDYSKGITQRLLIYEKFLEQHKQYLQAIKFLQITPKSRSDIEEYRNIQDEVAGQTGRINGKFSTINWSPIAYINKNIEQATLSLLYNKAKIAMVTPMRDGMNLVAKEYIASQNPSDPGVLILSRFTGAAQHLKNALIVNPIDTQSCVHALKTAISMSLDERIARWQPMKDYIDQHNTKRWCESFLKTLRDIA